MIGLLFWFLARSEPAIAADICDDPVAAVCGELSAPKVNQQQIRDQVNSSVTNPFLKKENSGSAKDSGLITDIELLQGYQKVVQVSYQAILGELAKKGISESDLMEYLAKVKRTSAGIVKDGGLGPFRGGLSEVSNSELSQVLSDIEFISPKAIANLSSDDPEFAKKMTSYYRECGIDGLNLQAGYNSMENKFFICPGILLGMVESGDLHTFDIIVGHELSHSVDCFAVPQDFLVRSQISQNAFPLWKKFVPFLNCVQKNYRNEFGTINEMISDLQGPLKERLNSYIENLKKSPGDHDFEIKAAEDQIQIAQFNYERISKFKKNLERVMGGAPPVVAETHGSELIADLGGLLTFNEMVKPLTLLQRKVALTHALLNFCPIFVTDLKKVNHGTLKDEGIHPPSEYRIRMALNNPETRSLIGCKELSGSGPWCHSAEFGAVIARCSSETDSSKAPEACQSRFVQELKEINCEYNSILCYSVGEQGTDCVAHSKNCELPALMKSRMECSQQNPSQFLKTGSLIPGVCINSIEQNPSNSTGEGTKTQ